MARYPVFIDAIDQRTVQTQSDEFALDQAAPGYRVLHLKQNGEFDTHIERVTLKPAKY